MNDREFGLCPVCGGVEARVLFSTRTPLSEFRLVRCEVCELTRTFPLPSDKTICVCDPFAYYGRGANKFIPGIQKIRNQIARLRAKSYLSLIPPSIQTRKILDVGCSEGRLLRSFLEYGCQCWGIEHASYPTQRFLNSDRIVYLQGDLQAINLPEGAFDLIFLWHVLEHMDDPELAMNRLSKLVAPGGAMILAVPNFSSMEAKTFKQHWFHLDVPWHKYHFSERSMRHLIAINHLRIIAISNLCFEQGPYGLFQSLLNAMGWPHNEFYEALKGNLDHGRYIHFIVQFLIGMFLLAPVFFVSLCTSIGGRGPILKLILKKEHNGSMKAAEKITMGGSHRHRR